MAFNWPQTPPTSLPPAGPGPGSINNLTLTYYSPTEFQIASPFNYVDNEPSGIVTTIPVRAKSVATPGDGVTDFASVPSFLWGTIASYGRQLPAALVHDQLCKDLKRNPAVGPAGTPVLPGPGEAAADVQRFLRDHADGVFLRALTDTSLTQPLPPFKSRLMWGGVSAARYAEFHRVRGSVALVGAVAGWFLVLAGVNVIHKHAASSSVPVLGPLPAWILWTLAGITALGSVIISSAQNSNPKIYAALAFISLFATLLALWKAIPDDSDSEFLAWQTFSNWFYLLGAVILLILGSTILGQDWLMVPLLVIALPILLPAVFATVVARTILWIPDKILAIGGAQIGGPVAGIDIME